MLIYTLLTILAVILILTLPFLGAILVDHHVKAKFQKIADLKTAQIFLKTAELAEEKENKNG